MDLNATARFVEQRGQFHTLRRFVGRNRAKQDVKLKAVVDRGDDQSLVNNVTQSLQTAIITNREIAAKRWPGPPKTGDFLISVDSGAVSEIASVDTVKEGTFVVRYNLTMKGQP